MPGRDQPGQGLSAGTSPTVAGSTQCRVPLDRTDPISSQCTRGGGSCSLLLTQMRYFHGNRFLDTSPATPDGVPNCRKPQASPPSRLQFGPRATAVCRPYSVRSRRTSPARCCPTASSAGCPQTGARPRRGSARRGHELARVLRRCWFLCDGIAVREHGVCRIRTKRIRCVTALRRRVIVIYVISRKGHELATARLRTVCTCENASISCAFRTLLGFAAARSANVGKG